VVLLPTNLPPICVIAKTEQILRNVTIIERSRSTWLGSPSALLPATTLFEAAHEKTHKDTDNFLCQLVRAEQTPKSDK
jgi:hypothetical protein